VSTAPATAQDFVFALTEDLNKKDLELPAFPDTVIRIQHALQSDDIDIDSIIHLIKSDPALTARILQTASSAATGPKRSEIIDVRRAVIVMGIKLVQSSVLAFALRQVSMSAGFSPPAKNELKSIWNESIDTAATCSVLAKEFTPVNPDEALLTGLLSVIGRLYIFMKSQQHPELDAVDLREIIDDWHPTIAKAIAESWGLSEALCDALAHQLEVTTMHDESNMLTDLLIAARLNHRLHAWEEPLFVELCPALAHVGICSPDARDVDLEPNKDRIVVLRRAMGG